MFQKYLIPGHMRRKLSNHLHARRRVGPKRISAVITTLCLAFGLFVVAQPAMAAAGTGPGYGAGTAASPHLGSFRLESGALVWCARAGAPSPVGVPTGGGVEGGNSVGTAPPGVSIADATARANYILNTWGTPSVSNIDAAAINLAVWHFLDYNNATGLTGGVGIRNYYSTRAGGDTAAVRAAFDAMLGMAGAVSAASPGAVAPPPGASMQLTTDSANSYLGALVVSGVESAGTVTLTDGLFTSGAGATGTAALSGVGNGSYSLRGVPPTDDGAPYTVAASGSFTMLGGWSDTVLWHDTPGRQVTVSAGSRVVQNFTLTATDPTPRATTFAPVLGTRVESPYVQIGGSLTDVVTFSNTLNEWPRTADGRYAIVHATGVLYGPLDAAPVETAGVPLGTPIAGTASVSTNETDGPDMEYRATADTTATGESAFYTWVWSIDFGEQPQSTQSFLAPGYTFQDRYGRLAETHLVPSVSTEAQETGYPGGTMIDTAIIHGLLPAAGADLSFAVYRAEPLETCTPESLIWTNADAPQRVTEPGRYDSPAVTIPWFGTFAWIETLRDTNGVLIHEGACMQPGELTRADPPIIESAAAPAVDFGGLATDTAIVNGPLPEGGETFVTFALYEALPDVLPAETCTPETLVADTLADPISVRELRHYDSPGVRLERAGTYYWIETLWWIPEGWTEDPIALASGRCGQPSETTVVAAPSISSHSQVTARAGEAFHDTVTVTGLAADTPAALQWDLYRHTAVAAPICDDTTRVFTSAPVAIVGSGSFLSPPTSQSVAARYFWVATLLYTPLSDAAGDAADRGEPVLLARGHCGQEVESTLVTALAQSGGGAAARTFGLLALGALVSGAGLIMLARSGRRGAGLRA